MTDYSVGTGSGGVLILRDDGFNLWAIIRSTNGSTFANGKSWSITVGGGSASGSFSISGAQEKVVWQGTLGSSAHVAFTMGATGTSGLGGPTTLHVDIFRATIPPPPIAYGWSNMSVQSGQINFGAPNGDGGSGIDHYLVRYGRTNPPEAGAYVEFGTLTGVNPVSGLEPGVTYYSRVYAHNAVGYSYPSDVWAGTTLAPVRFKLGGVYHYAIPYVKVAGVYRMCLGFVKSGGIYRQTK